VELAHGSGTGRVRCETTAPVTLIGSRPDCQLAINDAELSRLHAAVINSGEAIWVCDLRSRSGTFVNDQKINTARLRSGDRLRVGKLEIEMRFPEPAGPADGARGAEGAERLAAPLVLGGAGLNFSLERLPAVIGRRNTCDVALDTPDVSLAHALLFLISGCPVVYDLGSRSGTVLNGERVASEWLRNGDRLNIGGEELTVGWVGTTPPAPAAPAGPASAAGASIGAGDLSAPIATESMELDDLARNILALQSRVSSCRGELAERSARLDAREAELTALEAQLAAQRSDLEKRESQLATELASAMSARAELEKERSGLAVQLATLERGKADLVARRDELELRQRALAEQTQSLEAAQRQAAGRLAEAEKRTGELAALEASLAKREQAIAARESADAEARKRLDQLKDAVRQATQAFAQIGTTDVGPTDTGAAGAASEAPSGGGAPASPGHTGGASSGSESSAAPTERSPKHGRQVTTAARSMPTDDGLPAPVVAEPMFAAGGKPALEQLPTEVRERFLVLRRVSKKNDEDLLAQVLAEYSAAVKARAAAPGGEKKRKSWWS
jgi:pSer/pThr/pTyr-binding forkhead associated (FHA) protein/peptidoglycan hydrolase CwlO-like protein